MKLENWLAERLLSGALIVRVHTQRQNLGSGPFRAFDARIYAYRKATPRARHAVFCVCTAMEVDEAGRRHRGAIATYATTGSDESLTPWIGSLTDDWIPAWKEQKDNLFVVNRTPYPVCNPTMIKHLSRIQGGLEAMADMGRGDDGMCLRVAHGLDRIVINAQKDLQTHVAFPRS
mgnify:CR=1 FL=1